MKEAIDDAIGNWRMIITCYGNIFGCFINYREGKNQVRNVRSQGALLFSIDSDFLSLIQHQNSSCDLSFRYLWSQFPNAHFSPSPTWWPFSVMRGVRSAQRHN